MEGSNRTSSQTYDRLFVVLLLASLVLIFASVLLIEVFSVNYGIGIGALVQSNLTNTNVTQTLAPTALNVSSLRVAILEMYVIIGIAVGMFLLAFILYSMKGNRQNAEGRRYTLLHLVLALVFSGLFITEFLTFDIGISGVYLGIILIAMIASIAIDAFSEYQIHIAAPARTSRPKKELNINPSTPYSNLAALRDEIFANLSGRVTIVDKHFNSEALSNLHRLMSGIEGGINEVDVATSKGMLDSDFYKDYNDLKNEMRNRNITLSVLLMDDQDAVAQHERFIFDGNTAYKIPPMNIIHKKSEHITKIKTSDARRRFEQLQKNSITLENYAVKQARDQPKETAE